MSRFAVLHGPGAVAPYVEVASKLADQEKNALGFLSARAYGEAAAAGKLFVAVADEGAMRVYAGHLFCGGTFPFLKVFQVLVASPFRRKRVGSLLVQTLVKFAEDRSYLSISARVAEDLIVANAFWEYEGFEVIRRKSGGKSRGRDINVRERPLNTPSLFQVHDASVGAPLVYGASRVSRPLYVMDVNVFLDLAKRRARSTDAERLIGAAWNRAVDLNVTEEFVIELRRSAVPGQADPVLELASAFPRLPKVPESLIQETVIRLADIVFRTRAREGRLSKNDRSDLLHLACAIHHSAAGFVTGDTTILKCATELREQFGLDVVSAGELMEFTEPGVRVPEHELRSTAGGSDFEISEMSEESRRGIDEFLAYTGLSPELIAVALSPGASGAPRRRVQIRLASTDEYVGYAAWDAPSRLKDQIDIFVLVDEDHPDATALANHLFDAMARDIAHHGPKLINLRGAEIYSRVRAVAVAGGFYADGTSESRMDLRKVALGGAVTESLWPSAKKKITQLSGMKLPDCMPPFTGPETRLEITFASGAKTLLRLADVERAMFPALFAVPGREAVILPIRRVFAEHLFCGAPQLSLLPGKGAALSSDRMYFKSPRSNGLLQPGTPVVFYESGGGHGRKVAFASALVRTNRIMWAKTVSERFLEKGVLDREMVDACSQEGLVSVLHFDNILLFPRPVALARLRQLGAVDRANLVTARRLSAKSLLGIIEEGGALAL